MHKRFIKKLSRGEPPNDLGQHFINNRKLIEEIVIRANINKDDMVLEIGAGKGALTMVLSKKAGKVLAVEYDEKLVNILEQKTAQASNVKIIQQDILRMRMPKESFVVVSNIPYDITTPIMKRLLMNPFSGFQSGVIVMEYGAARRFTSTFIKNDYVLVWKMWYDVKYVRKISREFFSPRPRVDSAMVKITRKKTPVISYKDVYAFYGLAHYALKKPELPIDMALYGIFTKPQIKMLKRKLRIRSEKPIGTLNEYDWGIIFQTMVQYVPRPRWPRTPKKRWFEVL